VDFTIKTATARRRRIMPKHHHLARAIFLSIGTGRFTTNRESIVHSHISHILCNQQLNRDQQQQTKARHHFKIMFGKKSFPLPASWATKKLWLPEARLVRCGTMLAMSLGCVCLLWGITAKLELYVFALYTLVARSLFPSHVLVLLSLLRQPQLLPWFLSSKTFARRDRGTRAIASALTVTMLNHSSYFRRTL
jgi:hypothetical protein